MDNEQTPENTPMPPWTIQQEERFLHVLLGLVSRYEEFKHLEQECVELDFQRSEYIGHNFSFDWWAHLESMKELGLPTHQKSKEIADYWYGVGLLKGVNLSTGIVDKEMEKMPPLPEDPENPDDFDEGEENDKGY